MRWLEGLPIPARLSLVTSKELIRFSRRANWVARLP